jgi:hypothetical protein
MAPRYRTSWQLTPGLAAVELRTECYQAPLWLALER